MFKNATTFRRIMAGTGLLLAILAFGTADVIRLSIDGGKENLEQLAAIAADSGLWEPAAILNMVGLILFVPGHPRPPAPAAWP